MSSARPTPAATARRAAVGRRLWQGVFHGFYRCSAIDAHLVPRTGPVLLASNHSGLIDGPLVYGMSPRPTHFVVKQEMFHGVSGMLLRGMGQIPIDRSTADREAIAASLAVLARGGVVGVFPEGSRGRGDVAAVHAGVTFLAMASGAPVVPVACLGTRALGSGVDRPPTPGRRLAVVFGEPITLTLPTDLPRREASRRLTEQLRAALAEHVRTSAGRTGIPLHDESPLSAGLEDAS